MKQSRPKQIGYGWPQALTKILRMMKLATFFLFIGCLQVSAAAYSQKNTMTISLKDVSLEQVFNEITEESGYLFLYNNEKLTQIADDVSVAVKDATIEQVMDACLKGLPLSYEIMDRTVVITPHKALPKQQEIITQTPPNKTITGTVVDSATGNPIVGATVKVQGKSKGTVTGAEGKFSLEVEDDAVLEVSYLGYGKKVIVVSGKENLTISLTASATGLNQLVVVGYGTQKKKDVLGAISQIDVNNTMSRPSADIVHSLEGVIPGLNIKSNTGDPSSTPALNIRGFTSINGGSPLVLVDGIEQSLTEVNPNDIKSVTVLKDAGSAAIYGARGAFGVILITTKKGQAGNFGITYSNNFNFTTPTVRTDYVTNPYLFAKTIDAAIGGYNGSNYTGYNEQDYQLLKWVAEGKMAPFYQKQQDGTYKFYYKTDWYHYFFKEWQPSQVHNISVSGGSEKLNAYLSGRIFKRSSIQNVQDAGMHRYNFKANLNFNPYKWLKISGSGKLYVGRHDEFAGYNNGWGGVYNSPYRWRDLFPFQPVYIDGKPFEWGRSGNGGHGAVGALESGNNWRKFKKNVFVGTLKGVLKPVKGLELNINYHAKISNNATTYRLAPFSYLTSKRIESVTEGNNELDEHRMQSYYNALNVFGSYNKSIGVKNHLKLMIGFNQERYDYENIKSDGKGLLVDNKASLNFATSDFNVDAASTQWAIQGFFGRLNYDYDDKYLLEVNARYDGSSRFPQKSRWGLFPSVSLGWRINKENFWNSSLENIFPSVKLRASYGQLGNQNVGINKFRRVMKVGFTDWFVDGEPLTYARAPSPLPGNITWEKVNTLNFGIDLGLIQNKLTTSFDWYRRKTSDMYLPGKPLPAVFGAAEPEENYAALQNTGFELKLTYRNSFNVLGSKLRLTVSGNVSNFNGVITKFDNPKGLMSTFWEGEKLGQIWGYHVDGQFQSDKEAKQYQGQFLNTSKNLDDVYHYIFNVVTNNKWDHLRGGDIKYIDQNGDGKIGQGDNTLENHGDQIPIGNAMPKFPFGFSIRANWRNFDISIIGQGIGHQDWVPTGDIYWGTYERPYMSFIRKDLIANAWAPDNKDGIYPPIVRGYGAFAAHRSMYVPNDYYLTNIGYLRIKNMTVGYTLPQDLTKRIHIKEARVFFSGENIFTFRFGALTKYIDPELAGAAVSYSNPHNMLLPNV